VIKKLVLVLVVVFIWHGIAVPTAQAQNANPCYSGMVSYFPDPIPLGYWILGPGPGLYSFVIAVWNSICAPVAASRETCPTCPYAGGPISLATGNTFIRQTDVSLPGLGGGLTLTRTWNSVWPPTQIASSIGLFGPNWRSTYEERIFMSGDNYLKYARSDGSYWSFGLNSAGNLVVAAPANVSATLSQPSSYLLLKFQNGEQRQFNPATGLLTAIIDRNGNTTQLTYDSSNRLVTVTSPASQHLYFNYQSGSSLLVTSVTSDFGVTYSYSYDAQGRLSQVTKPDQTTVSFTYNTQSLITQVTDFNGKVLESHTYDSSGRGLTSSQANGVNTMTLTYP
jgi:YD repeat-containing protein